MWVVDRRLWWRRRRGTGTRTTVKTATRDTTPVEEEVALLLAAIDEFLAEVRYATIIEGWKVRDLLLDLRQLVKTN